MLFVPTELHASSIHGIGAFLLAPVKKGDLIWRFDPRIDRVYTQAEIEDLPPLLRQYIDTYACEHKDTGLWMMPGDNAKYFNHSDNPTALTLSIAFGDDIAAADLAAGTELTVNYRDVCDKTKTTGQL